MRDDEPGGVARALFEASRRNAILIWAALVIAALFPRTVSAQGQDTVRIRIVTEMGDVVAQLYAERAPITVANFLRYVDAKAFDGSRFYRVVRADNQPDDSVRIAVVQGGFRRDAERYPPIPLERTSETGLSHVDGTLSMARNGPDTARGDFSIMVGDQPELDFGGRRNPDGQGFAAFGRVLEGMDVVRRMNAAPADGQMLTPPIRIERIERITGR
jgi:peptidyl-prolyl cis-trans isomerase A (cyclophilin A)